MKTKEIRILAQGGKMADLRKRLKEIEHLVVTSNKPEQRLRNEAVVILSVLDN